MNSVEEADIEICASGFDNLLMEAGQIELRNYVKLLHQLGACKCAAVVAELLKWVDSEKDVLPIDVVLKDRNRYNQLWNAYGAASVEEDPRSRAEA